MYIYMDAQKSHDIFTKVTLQEKKNAIDFFQHYLPKKIFEQINLDSIEITKDSFVHSNYSDIHSDILFKVNLLGKPGYIYTLIDHKSSQDKFTAFQLLKYMIGIWELHIKQSKEEVLDLPIIIPMVLYHGVDKWKYGTDLLRIQEKVDGLAEYQVNFSYVLYDLSTYKDEEIKGELTTRIFLLLLKYIFRDDLKDKLYSILELLVELDNQSTGLEYVETVLRYLITGNRKFPLDKIQEMIQNVKSERVKNMMETIAETLEKKGFRRGIRSVRRKMKLIKNQAKTEVEQAKTEVEQAKTEVEQAKTEVEREKARAERKALLKTAIAMKVEGAEIAFISRVLKLEPEFLNRLYKSLS